MFQRLLLAGSLVGLMSAGHRQMFDNDAVQIVNRALGLTVALAILASFEPVGWLKRALRLEPYPV